MRKVIGAIALGLTLTACSSGTPISTSTSAPTTSSASTQTPTTVATSTAAVSSTGPTTPASPTASPTATSANTAQNALRAVQTAETSAKGKAIELDWDVNRWEVTVLDGKTKKELDVSADGQKVLRRETGVAEADDYTRLQSAKYFLDHAIKTATGTVPGDIDEVDLETRHGTLVWELSIDKAGAGSTHVYVDAVAGKIVS